MPSSRGYLLWQLITEPFQLPVVRHTKVFTLVGSSYPAVQLNVHTSPTTLPWFCRHLLGETVVPADSTRAEHFLARRRQICTGFHLITHTQSLPNSTNNLARVFFRVPILHRVGKGRTAGYFRKVFHRFKLQKVSNTTSLSQGRLLMIVVVVWYILQS